MRDKVSKFINPRVLFASTIGNTLEFYDFTLYGFFVAIISPLYFPANDPFISLISGFGVFAVGFLTRPIGGILFGHLGDKYGRKQALSLSVIMMSIPTLTIAFLPTYNQIGIVAPIVLVLARLIQGLCTGGEYNGAGIFIAEHTTKNRKAFTGSILSAGGILGALLANLSGAFFTQSWLPEWSWRIPFTMGLILALVGYYIRRKTIESPEYILKEEEIRSHRKRVPIFEVIRKHPKSFLTCFLIGSNTSVVFYLLLVYVNSNLLMEKLLNASEMMILNASMLMIIVISLPVIGRVADIFGHRKIMTLSALGVLLSGFPIVLITETRNLYLIIPMQAVMMIMHEGFNAPINAYMSRLFPVEYRYSGVAFGYSLGLSLFGGTAPYIVGWLVEKTQNPFMLGAAIMVGSFLGLLGLYISREQAPDASSHTFGVKVAA